MRPAIALALLAATGVGAPGARAEQVYIRVGFPHEAPLMEIDEPVEVGSVLERSVDIEGRTWTLRLDSEHRTSAEQANLGIGTPRFTLWIHGGSPATVENRFGMGSVLPYPQGERTAACGLSMEAIDRGERLLSGAWMASGIAIEGSAIDACTAMWERSAKEHELSSILRVLSAPEGNDGALAAIVSEGAVEDVWGGGDLDWLAAFDPGDDAPSVALAGVGADLEAGASLSDAPGWLGGSESYAGLLDASGPSIPPELAILIWGSTVPTWGELVGERERRGGREVVLVDDIEIVCDTRDDRVWRLVPMLPMDAVERLSQAWGGPVVTLGPARTWHFWYDEAAGLRAAAMEDRESPRMRLEILPYRPLEAQLGGRGHPFGFEGSIPLLDATRGALLEEHGPDLNWDESETRRAYLLLPAWEFSSDAVAVRLELDGGRVSRFTLQLSYLYNRNGRGRIVEALEAKLGPCHEEGPGPYDSTVSYTCPDAPGIELVEYQRSKVFELTVGPTP